MIEVPWLHDYSQHLAPRVRHATRQTRRVPARARCLTGEWRRRPRNECRTIWREGPPAFGPCVLMVTCIKINKRRRSRLLHHLLLLTLQGVGVCVWRTIPVKRPSKAQRIPMLPACQQKQRPFPALQHGAESTPLERIAGRGPCPRGCFWQKQARSSQHHAITCEHTTYVSAHEYARACV